MHLWYTSNMTAPFNMHHVTLHTDDSVCQMWSSTTVSSL